jgi:hypothetical protein
VGDNGVTAGPDDSQLGADILDMGIDGPLKAAFRLFPQHVH